MSVLDTPGPASAAGSEPVMTVTPEAAAALQQFAVWFGLDAVVLGKP